MRQVQQEDPEQHRVQNLLKIFASDPKCRFTILAIASLGRGEQPRINGSVLRFVQAKVMPAASMLLATSAACEGCSSPGGCPQGWSSAVPAEGRPWQVVPPHQQSCGQHGTNRCCPWRCRCGGDWTGSDPPGRVRILQCRSPRRYAIPIELVIDLKYAVEQGVIFFLSESDVMLMSASDAILCCTDGATGEVFWRNALRLEALEKQTSVELLGARQAVIVTPDEAFQTDHGHQVQRVGHADPLHRLFGVWGGHDAGAVEMPTLRSWNVGDDRRPAVSNSEEARSDARGGLRKSINQLMIRDFHDYSDVSKRGATSFEAKLIETAKNYDQRARKGFQQRRRSLRQGRYGCPEDG